MNKRRIVLAAVTGMALATLLLAVLSRFHAQCVAEEAMRPLLQRGEGWFRSSTDLYRMPEPRDNRYVMVWRVEYDDTPTRMRRRATFLIGFGGGIVFTSPTDLRRGRWWKYDLSIGIGTPLEGRPSHTTVCMDRVYGGSAGSRQASSEK